MSSSHGLRWAMGAGRRRLGAASVTVAVVVTSLGALVPQTAAARPADDPVVITDWNTVAIDVIVVDAGKANAEAFMWLAFTQAAVYNAVVGITERYEPYRWDPDAPHGASPEAAAAAAAFQVLKFYFPASGLKLQAAYDDSLLGVHDGRAERRGVRFGERAARRLITLRTDDGRGADVQFTKPPAPGVWRPTPPDELPFFNPWFAKMRPLLLRSYNQFRPGPPPKLTSDRYTKEFNEVKRLGSLTGSDRSSRQTETALFFSDTTIGPLHAALRDLVTRRHMDISESARLFAAVDTSIFDGIGGSWDSKLRYGFWRPITAIQLADTDGNPDTDEQADWEPFLTTPPYPDYTSGLTTVVGAASRALTRVLGTNRIDLTMTSLAAGVTRHYEFAGKWNRDAVNARVWSGIHFRTADVLGNAMGKKVGNWALDHYFAPTGDDD
ncbi:MAG TPA: vanadium-dependent haloperoxidase [Actinomycetota bacterium]|nr:vanadium-dependent haloperoxidase [Actinomycetota bacterium]